MLLIGIVIAYSVTTFKPTTRVHIGSGVYDLWIADSETERTQGLSGVKKMSPSGGLLMKFDSDSQWGIWMKDMEIHLDIVWLDADKKVVYIVKNASPATSTDVTYRPKEGARYVIELSAGSVDKSAIRKGVVAEFDETVTKGMW